MRLKSLLLTSLLLAFVLASAQSDTVDAEPKFLDYSLEDLMNISIYSVSKTEEAAFDAPLSSSVVTHEEIERAGCTTIMEALRLVPGVIVREQTNGNYDIHIRGLDNVPPNLGLYFFESSTTLVMIDNRPVYNYLHGGTFWETLPIDLNDVERIEVVRGPSTAMYGPNAESGVINIITRKAEKKGVYVVVNGQYGRFNTGIANGTVGYKFSKKISAAVSGNFQNRERTQTDYYSNSLDAFIPIDSFVVNDSLRDIYYPHPRLSMRKYGYNGFFNYDINKRASIAVQGGGQHSEIQDMFASDYLTTSVATSYYANLRGQFYGVNLQASYLMGTQQPQLGTPQGKWDFNTVDVVLDYNMTAVKNLVITPGVSFRRAEYDDRKYVNESIREGFFNNKVASNTYAAYLRGDYKLFRNKLRLVAAGRMDKFTAPSKLYFSWQFAATYKLAEDHLLRIVGSRANRAPLFLENFYDLNVPIPGFGSIQLLGNKNLNLLTTDMLEIGYRGRIRENLEIDLEVFGSTTKNFSSVVLGEIDTTGGGTDFLIRFQNLPLIARQFGGTLSVNYIIAKKFQIKPFITIQRTMLFNYSIYAVDPNVPESILSPKPEINNIYSGMGTQMKHVATPTVYGGAYFNFQITREFNLNLNSYFMSGHTQLESANLSAKDGKRGVENITPKLLMNVVASYTFFKKLTVFMNFKNCFNNRTREFYRADVPGFKVSGGAHFEF